MAAKRATARKTAARKSSAKKASSRKAAPRKAAAKKTAAKRSAAKKSAAKRSTAKRSSAKKSAAKRSAAKRTTKKSAARKSAAKRSVAKKSAAKKSAAKKAVAKKAVAKRRGAAKKSIPRSVTEGATGASADGLELLMSDHREVEQLFSQFEAASPSSNIAQEIGEKIIKELSVHAVVEEQVLYPAARKAIDEGEVDHAIDEHQEVKELLAKVDGKSIEDDDVRSTFQEIKSNVEEHVQEEENEMFPKLRDELDQEELQKLGKQMERAKQMAPTRPHPNAPNTPPGNVVAGVGASVVDRIRDKVGGRKKS